MKNINELGCPCGHSKFFVMVAEKGKQKGKPIIAICTMCGKPSDLTDLRTYEEEKEPERRTHEVR